MSGNGEPDELKNEVEAVKRAAHYKRVLPDPDEPQDEVEAVQRAALPGVRRGVGEMLVVAQPPWLGPLHRHHPACGSSPAVGVAGEYGLTTTEAVVHKGQGEVGGGAAMCGLVVVGAMHLALVEGVRGSKGG